MASPRQLDIAGLTELEKETEAYQIALEKVNHDRDKHPLYQAATNIMKAVMNLKATKLRAVHRYNTKQTTTEPNQDQDVINAQKQLLATLDAFQRKADTHNKPRQKLHDSSSRISSFESKLDFETAVLFDPSTRKSLLIAQSPDFKHYSKIVDTFYKTAFGELSETKVEQHNQSIGKEKKDTAPIDVAPPKN